MSYEARLDWKDAAVCAQADPAVMYPGKGGTTAPAKMLCAACLVRSLCLGYALAHEEPAGVWGGLSVRERRRLTAVPDTHPAWTRADQRLEAAAQRRARAAVVKPQPAKRRRTPQAEINARKAMWLEMWKTGATDREMADAAHVAPWDVVGWRRRYKLALNPSEKARAS